MRRPPLGAHRSPQGRGRARLRLLHEHESRKGRSWPPTRTPRSSSTGRGAPPSGDGRRRGGAAAAGRGGGVLPHAAAREPPRRMGVAAELLPGREALELPIAEAEIGSATRCPCLPGGAATSSGRPARVLAEPPQPPARALPLQPGPEGGSLWSGWLPRSGADGPQGRTHLGLTSRPPPQLAQRSFNRSARAVSPSTRIFPVRKAPIGLCSPLTMRRKVLRMAMTQSAGASLSSQRWRRLDVDAPAARAVDVEAVGAVRSAARERSAPRLQVLEELAGGLRHQRAAGAGSGSG